MLTFTTSDGTMAVCPDEFFTTEQERMLLGMCRPSQRRDLSDTLATMRASETALLAQATDAQKLQGTGDRLYFRRRWPGPMPGETGTPAVTIYGRIRSFTEMEAAELRAGATHTEARTLIRGLREGWARGLRACECFSTTEPNGETGYVHVGVMEPITAGEFNAARADGWPAAE